MTMVESKYVIVLTEKNFKGMVIPRLPEGMAFGLYQPFYFLKIEMW